MTGVQTCALPIFSESLDILGKFKLGGHIDPDLFDIFVKQKVYLKYAEKFLDPEQIDEVDESRIPGYGQPVGAAQQK